MYYSATTGGFYSEDIHGKILIPEKKPTDVDGEFVDVVVRNPNTKIPEDAVWVDDGEYQFLLTEQTKGKIITSDESGKPKLKEIVLTLDEVRTIKLRELADYRYTVEVGGILINGITIYTDPISQSKLTGAWVKMQMTPTKTINWKGENGWVKTTKSDIEAIAVAVADHVQTCFDMEYQHSQLINSIEDVELLSAYDVKTGWPTNALGVING